MNETLVHAKRHPTISRRNGWGGTRDRYCYAGTADPFDPICSYDGTSRFLAETASGFTPWISGEGRWIMKQFFDKHPLLQWYIALVVTLEFIVMVAKSF